MCETNEHQLGRGLVGQYISFDFFLVQYFSAVFIDDNSLCYPSVLRTAMQQVS